MTLLLAEMLDVLALSVMEEEEAAFWLHINWSKTKTVQFCNPATCSTVQVADRQVEVVDSFVYLGSTIESIGGSIGDRDPASDRIGMELQEPHGKKNLEI